MQNINIVFDTNAYRNLTFGLSADQAKELFNNIRTAEEANKITSLLSAVTLLELLTHLHNPTDPGYHHCKIAIVGAYHHVQEGDNFRILPDPELLIEQMLFQHVDVEQKDINLALGQIAYAIHQDSANKNIVNFNNEINAIKKVVDQHEKDFVDDVRSAITQMDSDAANWQLFKNDKNSKSEFLKYIRSADSIDILARAFVIRTINNLRIQPPSKQDIDNMTREVVKVFKTPLTLYAKMMERMTISGYDMTNVKKKRWNTIWDIYLLFCISDEKIAGKETIFVTEEDWLHEVSSESGHSNKIIKLSDYKLLIGI